MRAEAARSVAIPMTSRVATIRSIAYLLATFRPARSAEPEVPEPVPTQCREHVRLDTLNLLRGSVDRLLEVRDDVAAVIPVQLLRRDGQRLTLVGICCCSRLVDEARRTMLGGIVPTGL